MAMSVERLCAAVPVTTWLITLAIDSERRSLDVAMPMLMLMLMLWRQQRVMKCERHHCS